MALIATADDFHSISAVRFLLKKEIQFQFNE